TCNLLKARLVIYAYNHHVRLLSPEPAVVEQPQFTRVEEPTLLCNHVARTVQGRGLRASRVRQRNSILGKVWEKGAAVPRRIPALIETGQCSRVGSKWTK